MKTFTEQLYVKDEDTQSVFGDATKLGPWLTYDVVDRPYIAVTKKHLPSEATPDGQEYNLDDLEKLASSFFAEHQFSRREIDGKDTIVVPFKRHPSGNFLGLDDWKSFVQHVGKDYKQKQGTAWEQYLRSETRESGRDAGAPQRG